MDSDEGCELGHELLGGHVDPGVASGHVKTDSSIGERFDGVERKGRTE
jgi:hypothetical protein